MRKIISIVACGAIALSSLGAHALGTNEKGCLVGGAVGAGVGHLASGNKTLLGAAVGCGAGVLVNKQRVKKQDERAKQARYDDRQRARVVNRERRDGSYDDRYR